MESARERKRPIPAEPADSAAAVSTVLGNGDLLREILLHLDFPTCLVRAAAVCRRWLRHASDPAFLYRFGDLHPPRHLGFYLTTKSSSRLEFVPMLPQPPELAAVLRRGCFSLPLDTEESSSVRRVTGIDCRNGRLFFGLRPGGQITYGVHSPFHPARAAVFAPEPPVVSRDIIRHFFSREGEAGDRKSYFWFSLECAEGEKARAYLYVLQDDAWCIHASAVTQISGWPQSAQKMPNVLIIGDRIYLVITVNYILVFDWTTSSFSTVELPEGVDDGGMLLSPANDSGLYLVHFQVDGKLSIWHRRRVSGSVGDWLQSTTFCLHDMCANLDAGNVTFKHAVGDNAEFLFFVMGKCVLYLDVTSKALHKVYEVTETDEDVGFIHPFMMIWPPTFPALKE